MVQFNIGPVNGKLVLEADQEDMEGQRRTFRFRGGFFLLEALWGGAVTLPYPVPFRLLGDRAVGWLETTGYDEGSGLRAALGNKGTRFVFRRASGAGAPADVEAASTLYAQTVEHETDAEERAENEGLAGRAVVVCPQQFGGKPGDYAALTRELRARGHPVYVARLSLLDWLSILKSTFSEAYFKGELEPSVALPFYMNAIDAAVARTGDGTEFAILSHSIGGWVARAWLGEVAAPEVRARCKAYVSLGTPHQAPPEGSLVAKADQTRGLLKYVNDRWPGGYWDGIRYTCVASRRVVGRVAFDLDALLGFASYFALIGEGGVEGDGITPVKAALPEGADAIVLDDVYHADVLPNPIGGRNTRLVGCRWYADKIEEWAGAL